MLSWSFQKLWEVYKAVLRKSAKGLGLEIHGVVLALEGGTRVFTIFPSPSSDTYGFKRPLFDIAYIHFPCLLLRGKRTLAQYCCMRDLTTHELVMVTFVLVSNGCLHQLPQSIMTHIWCKKCMYPTPIWTNKSNNEYKVKSFKVQQVQKVRAQVGSL